MASKRVLLLLSSDRISYPLIRFLTSEGKIFGWKIRIGCMADPSMAERIGHEKFSIAPDIMNIAKMQECEQAIKRSDLVIGVVTDLLLLQVADACLLYRKSLIAPSALNRQMVLKKAAAKDRGILLLMDCGFSPGLDHITAKKMIDNIHAKGGKITSFKTYSGSFIPQTYVDNPWGFKMVEPVGELLTMGRQNNRHLVQGHLQHIPYHRLFERCENIDGSNLKGTVVIPAGDSLYYKKVYRLSDAHTVVKGKLMPKGFDRIWNILVRLGLTDNTSRIDFCGEGLFCDLLDSFVPYSETGSLKDRLQQYTGASPDEMEKLKWLGLFDASMPACRTGSPADRQNMTAVTILQQLLEAKLTPVGDEPDQVIMEHQLSYEFRDEQYEFKATLISKGDNVREGALAKAIGLTCGIAAKSLLLGSITVKGLHTPVIREIYDPILNELSDLGVAFHVEERKLSEPEAVLK